MPPSMQVAVVHQPSGTRSSRGSRGAAASTATRVGDSDAEAEEEDGGDTDGDGDAHVRDQPGRPARHAAAPMYAPVAAVVWAAQHPNVMYDCCGCPVSRVSSLCTCCLPRCLPCRSCAKGACVSTFFVMGIAMFVVLLGSFLLHVALLAGGAICNWQAALAIPSFMGGFLAVGPIAAAAMGAQIHGKYDQPLLHYIPVLTFVTVGMITLLTTGVGALIYGGLDDHRCTVSGAMNLIIVGTWTHGLALCNGIWWLVTEIAVVD